MGQRPDGVVMLGGESGATTVLSGGSLGLEHVSGCGDARFGPGFIAFLALVELAQDAPLRGTYRYILATHATRGQASQTLTWHLAEHHGVEVEAATDNGPL